MKAKILLRPGNFRPSLSEWKIEGVMNPAAVRMKNQKVFLFARVAESPERHRDKTLHCPIIVSKNEYETTSEKIPKGEIASKDKNLIYLKNGMCRLTNISHFKKIILKKDGLSLDFISDTLDFTGTPADGEYGVEDPRITKLGGKYYMTYVSVSKRNGVSTSLAESEKLDKWYRKGIIFREQNKDCVLFPEKINGRYVALNRPEVFYEFHKPAIWISYSKDLKYWGDENSLILPREKSWESERIGAGPPPIKTRKGWLLIYHGVKSIRNKNTYAVGSVLLDLKNPEKIIARTSRKKPLIKPDLKAEKKGFMNNVVFPTGIIWDANGKDILLYSGGADSVITVRKIRIDHILKHMERC